MKRMLCLALIGASCINIAAAGQPSSYELMVSLSPDTGTVQVDGQVRLRLDDLQAHEFAFDLHDTFRISTLTVNNEPAEFRQAGHQDSNKTHISRSITVAIPPAARQSEVVMGISYHGRLQRLPEFGTQENGEVYLDDAVTSERIELSSYSAWYPSFGFGAHFDSVLLVSLPKAWKLVCIGRVEAIPDGGSRCIARAVNDLVIVASPRFESFDVLTPSGGVSIFHTDLPESYVARQGDAVSRVLHYFSQTIGTASSTESVVKQVYSPRKQGQGGYARTGMIVISQGRVLELLEERPDASTLGGLAHETAHFWWNFGAGQGDWINEAFAEYFGLLALREIEGDMAYETKLARLRQSVADLPADASALSEVPPSNDGHGYVIRYFKGALMLHHFHQVLGDTGFYRASASFYEQFKDQRTGTEDFRRYWGSTLDPERGRVDAWLDSKGDLPRD